MWSDEHYEYERLPRERLSPHPENVGRGQIDSCAGQSCECSSWSSQTNLKRGAPEHDGQDDFPLVVSFALKKPPLLERPGQGRYCRFEYSHTHVGYLEYEEGRDFAHEKRSGPPHRSDDPEYRWPRDDHPASRQPDYRDIQDDISRKNIYPHYTRDRSPQKRDSPYFRESPVSRRDSPHSRSGSSVSSRSYSPDRSKGYAFHQSQHGRSVSSLHKINISQGKERTTSQPLKTRDVSPSKTAAAAPSKALDKSSRLSEKELVEAADRWPAEKAEKADTSNLPEMSEYDAGTSEPLYVEQHEKTSANITDSNELFEDSQHISCSKAIAAKTKEIEQVDCGAQPMACHQTASNPVPELEKVSVENAQQQSQSVPKGPRPPVVTWGAVKRMTLKAQQKLRANNQPETPENLCAAIFAVITANSLLGRSVTV